ncbi:MAG: AsmA family protein [Pseudolabrys sp.]
MTAAIAFKRLGIALAAAIVCGGGALIAATSLVSTDAVRERVKNEISAVTGLDPVLRGEIDIALFPSGSVSFFDVALGDAAAPALTAERLTARLRFFPLLLGRVEIADISLERPSIAVTFAPSGTSNWTGLIEALTRAQKPSSHVAAFSEIRINDGKVVLRDQVHDITETFDHVEVSLAWPSISKSFGATGRMAWRGEMVDASMSLGDFPAALAGAKTGLKLRIAGAPIKAAFDGSFSTVPTLKAEGTLAADAASLRAALRWTGQKPVPSGGFGRFALKAQTNIVGGTIALSSVNVELDGNTADGVLTFATDGRQTLQGTLAADTLDLTPYVSTVRLLTSNQREWSSGRLTLDGLTGFDVDLRLSAAKLILSGAKLGRTAIAANLRGGHLAVTIGELQGFGGVIKGSLALANFETGVEIKSQLQFTDVDLESCLGELVGLHRVEGKGNLAFALEGSGDSVMALTHTLSGTASLSGAKGTLAGLDVEQLLRRLERRPLSGAGDFRNGRTPYDKITLVLKIAQGNVAVDDLKIEGPAVRLALAGLASIPARELDLKGNATLVAPASSGGGFDLPFFVTGTWDSPLMLPDPQALIRRSGAAAPLLDAVRDRKARDALRSAVERLTGAQPAPATAPEQPKQ